jgi:hypothetical protein
MRARDVARTLVSAAPRLLSASSCMERWLGKTAEPADMSVFATSSGPAGYGFAALLISTANTCTGPSMFDRKTIHFMSGENVTWVPAGSRVFAC